MHELVCQGCGAIFTSDSNTVPSGLVCSCQNKDFKMNMPTLPA